jgi:uncharacterized metal-binding protein
MPGLILFACLGISLVCVAYPIYVIRPFRAQGAGELAVALAVSRFRPTATMICAVAAAATCILFWPARWLGRILLAAGALLTCALALLARVNVYELMFHPIEAASFSSAPRARLDQDEKVIAIGAGGAARAYPIRILSYHHVINDLVDRVAVVATY